MSNEELVEGKCNASTRDGGYCASWPVNGRSRCRMHGGADGSGQGDGGPPEGNGNAETHGLSSDETLLYQRLDDPRRAEVDRVLNGLLEDLADEKGYSGPDEVPRYFQLPARRVAMNMVRTVWFVEDWEADSGFEGDVDNELVNRSVQSESVGPDGESVSYDVSENFAQKMAQRLSKENRQWLKDMGLLGTDNEEVAEQIGQSLAAVAAEHGDF